MTVTVVAMVTINEDQPYALAKYLELTEPLLEAVGAKIARRFVLDRDVVGRSPVKTVIVVDYPDLNAVDQVFSSEEYAKAIPFRDQAFADYSIHVAS